MNLMSLFQKQWGMLYHRLYFVSEIGHNVELQMFLNKMLSTLLRIDACLFLTALSVRILEIEDKLSGQFLYFSNELSLFRT